MKQSRLKEIHYRVHETGHEGVLRFEGNDLDPCHDETRAIHCATAFYYSDVGANHKWPLTIGLMLEKGGVEYAVFVVELNCDPWFSAARK